MTQINSHRIVTALSVLAAIGLGMAATPSAKAQQLTTLYSFCSQGGSCTDGNQPYAGVVQGTDGNFYGTTLYGGASNGGTVFKINSTGTQFSTLYSFCSQSGCTDGEWPWAGLVQGTDGNFYGTTQRGGASAYCSANGGCGTVFKMSASGALIWDYSFCSQSNCTDGYWPGAGLVQGTDGNFYGTTQKGGQSVEYGTVFKITPSGALTTLYSFSGPDGQWPLAGLAQGTDGNFYGTTAYGGGGFNAEGTVFKITPSGALTTLHTFCSQGYPCADGNSPEAGLVQGSDGNFYGTTLYGGANGRGTAFKMTPSGTLMWDYSFCSRSNCADGIYPRADLVQGSDGNFYGTTGFGGAYGCGYPAGCGTVFKITTSGTLTTLYSFCSQGGCTDGEFTIAALVQDSDGNFYGTTMFGGASNDGTVFKLSVGQPIASLSPTSLTFTDQNLGTTSPPQAVTLSNTGTETLTVASIVASGDFAEKDNCNGSVAAGGSCTINVTFTPTQTGTRTGTLTVTDNSGGVDGSQQTASLTGTGIDAKASVSPSSLAFGKQVINTTSATKEVTLTSTGTTDLKNVSFTITGGNAGDFAETSNCPATLVPGAKCEINVTFTPSVLGAESATLDVNDNAPDSPQTVALSGTGAAPVTLMPASFNFGPVEINTTSDPQDFTLENNQTVALSISSITLSVPNFAETDNCNGGLAAKSSCTISVKFAPTGFGKVTGTLTVNENAPAPYSTVTSSLSGTGVADVTLTPASASFGNVAIMEPSSPKSFTLKNNQLAVLNISSIAFTGTNAADFFQTNTCGSSIMPKTSCAITAILTPSLLGAESATLTVKSDAPAGYGTVTSSLSGAGVPPATLTPTSASFGNVALDTASNPKNFTLKNNQLAALSISNIASTGTNAADFSQTNTCGGSLAGKTSCTISVTLTPGVLGAESATLTVSNNAPAPYNALTSSLTGTGVAQATASPTSLTFPKQTVGTTSAPQNVTLKNNLLTDLSISGLTFAGADSGDYAVSSTTCGSSLPSKTACTVSVTFTPTATGTQTALLNVSDSANNSPQAVSLTGTGK